MPRKIQDVTKDYLVNVPLPVHGNTYTVISHQSIIDYAYAELANHGFGIVKEEYRCTQDGQIAQGIYRLHHQSDPELALMFAWTNSYNKQIKFKCATGAYVDANSTVMLGGEVGSYTRKHTGTADADTIASMQAQITNAQMYYNMLAQDKDIMKGIPLTKKKQAELLGVLFADHEVLTTEQASIIRQQMTKPTYFYNGGKDTLWAFYNHVTVAFQNSHPRTWMEDQRILHWFISNEFDLSAPVQLVSAPPQSLSAPVDPLLSNYGQPENQTNLLVQIAEETGDDSLLKAQYPVTPDDSIPDMLVQTEELTKEEVVETYSDVLTEVQLEAVKEETAEEHEDHSKAMHEIAERMKEGDPKTYNALAKAQRDFENQLVFGKTEILDIPEGTEIVEKEVEFVEAVIDELEADPNVKRFSAYDEDGNLIYNSGIDPIVIPTPSDEPDPFIEEFIKGFGEPDTVHYTDPVGNTFEAPVVEDKEPEVAPHRVKFAIDEVEEVVPTLEPSPEDYALVEKEDSVVDDAGFDFDLELNEEKQVDDDNDFDFFI